MLVIAPSFFDTGKKTRFKWSKKRKGKKTFKNADVFYRFTRSAYIKKIFD
jgi:hypothetical protein